MSDWKIRYESDREIPERPRFPRKQKLPVHSTNTVNGRPCELLNELVKVLRLILVLISTIWEWVNHFCINSWWHWHSGPARRAFFKKERAISCWNVDFNWISNFTFFPSRINHNENIGRIRWSPQKKLWILKRLNLQSNFKENNSIEHN